MLATALAIRDTAGMQLPRHFNDHASPAPPLAYANPQNSGIRSVTRNPLERSAHWLVETYPGLTATHITMAGTVGAVAVAALSQRFPRTARAASWIHLAASLTDAWDGPVARARTTKTDTPPSLAGSLIDTGSDRVQEFAAGLAQAQLAFKSGNRLGGYAQLGFAATSVMPSLSRSIAESRGIVVAEGALGSRHSRVTLNCLGYFWNQQPQRVTALGMVGTALNIQNTAKRLDALREGSVHNKGQIDPAKQEQAKVRAALLGVLAIGSSVMTYRAARASRT